MDGWVGQLEGWVDGRETRHSLPWFHRGRGASLGARVHIKRIRLLALVTDAIGVLCLDPELVPGEGCGRGREDKR